MSVRTRFLLVLIAFAVVPMAVLGVWVFTSAQRAIEEARITQLASIADLKKDRIESFFSERKADIASAAAFPDVRLYLPELASSDNDLTDPAIVRARSDLDQQLMPFRANYGYHDVVLIDPKGRVVYAADEPHRRTYLRQPYPRPDVFASGSKGLFFSDVFIGSGTKPTPEMVGAAPVLDLRGSFAGVIAVEIDLESTSTYLQDPGGLGSTGEVVIARRDGDSALLLFPSRSDPGAALVRRVAFGEGVGMPIQRAARGETGEGVAKDYRGVEVLAAWRYLPEQRWGLVAKLDAREAFAPVRVLRNLVLVAALVILAVGMIIAILAARSITRPIRALQRGAEEVTGGNLDHHLESNAPDEVGALSRAFARMTRTLAAKIAEQQATAVELRRSHEELERRVAERTVDLSNANAALTRSNAELEQFAYVASHDLQEPLRMISSYVQLIARRYRTRLDSDADEFIAFAVEGADRMQRMINDLLALSRIGTRGRSFGRVATHDVLAAAVSNLQVAIDEARAAITHDPLPVLVADEGQLVQLFQNLIGNAIKFRREAPPAIHVSATDAGSEWVFAVSDNGIGIEREYFDRVFVIFQRLHGKERYPGTGIGLAICKKIVERHGGRIWVESEVGAGTRVSFSLPKQVGS
jgi:signal transduction histidine kinase